MLSRLKYYVICLRKNLGHSISVWRISAVVSQAIRSCAHFLDPTGLWSSSERCGTISCHALYSLQFTPIYSVFLCAHLMLYGCAVSPTVCNVSSLADALKALSERLKGPFNIQDVVGPIEVKISDAIMNFQDASATIPDKVRLIQSCDVTRLLPEKRLVSS